MNKIRKILISVMLAMFLLLTVANVSAGDLVVNKNTTHSDIDSWMKNSSTVKGNNLIFNTTNYELSDTLNVSKSINIKSNVKTQISFNKNKDMFYVVANGINFSGLTLQHNSAGTFSERWSVITSPNSSITLNLKNMTFILNNNYMSAVTSKYLIGNITNCNVIGKGYFNNGIVANNLVGNIYKSSFKIESTGMGIGVTDNWIGNISYSNIINNGITSFGMWISGKWVGNCLNTNISGSGNYFYGIFANNWAGKISGSRIFANGYVSLGVCSNSSTKATITNSVISAKRYYAVMVSKNVKVTSSTLTSAKGKPKIYVIGPRVGIYDVRGYTNKRTYNFRISNIGESTSKTSYLIIKAKGFNKKVKIKPIKAGKTIKVKVILPQKYSTSKFVKYATVQYLDGYGKKTSFKATKFRW